MELYHITAKKHIASILKNGLKPKLGPRSKYIEQEPILCLTEKKYIPHWQILLGIKDPVILKINTTLADANEVQYSFYNEIRTRNIIDPDQFTIMYIDTDNTIMHDTMHDLCVSYVYDLSWLCQACARYYTPNVQKTISYNDLQTIMLASYDILNRLDFSVISPDEKRSLIKNYGENGEFTPFDMYLDTDKKLYQLTMYDDPNTEEIRSKIESFIRSEFANCLDLCTGGWDHIV